MPGYSDKANAALMESLHELCTEHHQIITLRRGDPGFDDVAEIIDIGSSAPDGAAIILLTDRYVYLIDGKGSTQQWTWAAILDDPNDSIV